MNNKWVLSACWRYVTRKVKNNKKVIIRATKTDNDTIPIPDVSITVKWWPSYLVVDFMVDCGTDVVDFLC